MFNSIKMIQEADERIQESAAELLQSISRTLIYTISAIFFASTLATAIWPNTLAMNIWPVLPLFIISSWLVLKILPHHFILGQIIWQISLLVTLALMTYLFSNAEIAMLVAFLPLLSAITLGWPAGLAMEILICVII